MGRFRILPVQSALLAREKYVVFKKLLGALGVGAPSVDTVLSDPNTRPGMMLDGQVNLVGGSRDVTIEHVAVGLVTRVEIESEYGEHDGLVEFCRVGVAGGLRLGEGERVSLPLRVPVPWETPVTDVYGQRLHGMAMGLRTEVAISGAVDKGDLDPVFVHPLPVQERILAAFDRLGFRFKGADLEAGRIYGLAQTLPFYQEIEFFAAPQYAQVTNEVELTFVTSQRGVEVILECDKRGGFLSAGHDVFGRYAVPHTDADRTDWVQVVDGWLRETTSRYGSLRAHGFGAPHGHHGGHGSGMGGMVAGAALGVVGGLVAGELIEDAFEGDFDDFGGDFE